MANELGNEKGIALPSCIFISLAGEGHVDDKLKKLGLNGLS